MDFHSLATLRLTHPAWRLLRADHAPLVVSFLHKSFLAPNVRTRSEQDAAAHLEDHLFEVREQLGGERFPRGAREYLQDWCSDDAGWLRRYYPTDSDEPCYDLTPAAEKGVGWLASLKERPFVATESRLMTVFELLRQIVHGTETNPDVRLAELAKRRAQIDAEIERVREGRVDLMDATRVKDRFLQASETANALLGDFRELEQNFRDLDRAVRERIATWDGGKGELLAEVFGDRDEISDSDQGKSFQAFWDFLMSIERQDELTALLRAAFELPAVEELATDPRLLRIHYDWLDAGEGAQRTIARLSDQLRRFLDDQAWQENRRIMQILKTVEQHALALRGSPPTDLGIEIDAAHPSVELPFERPLFSPAQKARLHGDVRNGDVDDDEIPADALFNQVFVDKSKLATNVRRALMHRDQISLAELVELHPLERGLAELMVYLSLAVEGGKAVVDENDVQTLVWTDGRGKSRRATMPLVLFSR